MNGRHILMLLSNPYRPDPRVRREALGLLREGWRVSVVAWDRRDAYPARERLEGVSVLRVGGIRSGYTLGWRQGFYLPRFWVRACRLARGLQPAAVHCHDLDTLPAGFFLKRRLGLPLVYDAHENYPALMSLHLPRPLVQGLQGLERLLVRGADVILTAGRTLARDFAGHVSVPVVTSGNFADLEAFQSVDPDRVAQVRRQLGGGAATLRVGYIGGFSFNRLLLPFIEAAKLLPEVQFHVWGDGPQRRALEEALRAHPNARYHGWLREADLPVYFRALDVVYYALRTDYPGARYNAPNTLYQAMAAGRPLIAGGEGDLAQVVRETGCGVLLEAVTPANIAAAVRSLASAAARARMGGNGLRAARVQFNAGCVQRQLAEIYSRLLPCGR